MGIVEVPLQEKELKWIKIELTGRRNRHITASSKSIKGQFHHGKRARKERFEPKSRQKPTPGRASDLYQGQVRVLGGHCQPFLETPC